MLYEFIRLDFDHRARACWDKGSFVTEGVTKSYRLLYFWFPDFYAEIRLDRPGEKIAHVTGFKEGNLYERMVHHMKLERLY
jgi:hypothetical protein